jgi:hypothetical protein
MAEQNALEWLEDQLFNHGLHEKTYEEKKEFQEIIKKNTLKTKAQQLGITEFPYFERDEKNRILYYEREDGYWYKQVFHKCGQESLVFFNDGLYLKRDFTDKGKQTYSETFWDKSFNNKNEKPKKRGRPKINKIIPKNIKNKAIKKFVPSKKLFRDNRNSNGGYYIANCNNCGIEFYPRRSSAKYCTSYCCLKAHKKAVINGTATKRIKKQD